MPIYTYKSKDGKHTKEILVNKVISSREDPGIEVEINGEKVYLYRVEVLEPGGEMKMNWGYWNPSKKI